MFSRIPGRHAAPPKARWWHRRLHTLVRTDDGMTTAEYAVGTVAAAALAGVLLVVVKDNGLADGLRALFLRVIETAA